MKIDRFIVGMDETNAYIIYDEDTLEALVIDPGDDQKTLTKGINRNSLKPIGIIVTHCHFDHIGGAEGLKKIFNIPIMAHKKEVEGLMDPQINYSAQMRREDISLKVDTMVTDGSIIRVGGLKLEVIHTPGHTPGGICLKESNSNIVFTGDTVFEDDLGRTDLTGGNEEALRKSIMNKVSRWSDTTVIYPGHGQSSTIGDVRSKNVKYFK
ncbi:MBL fold metallo-hydrolase [Alkaliphilus serpentinus]|uniref:MBL fold metallo-hydrolase n=1 Tax=Alkaliphilus serpentinus TaxID=1482731 RepID=A0A833HNI2_9FIRM|nr:MBL fold metallo-hydrolase [Alkaliphilus serpentinus]KAB3528848.1 MBL fold metallo-hydrolase [Alkaliphilus serpentinus]